MACGQLSNLGFLSPRGCCGAVRRTAPKRLMTMVIIYHYPGSAARCLSHSAVLPNFVRRRKANRPRGHAVAADRAGNVRSAGARRRSGRYSQRSGCINSPYRMGCWDRRGRGRRLRLASSSARQGPGGPSGLQNRQGGVDWVSKVFPQPIIRGIQLSVGLLFCELAWKLVSATPKAFIDHRHSVWWLGVPALRPGCPTDNS